MSDYDDASAGYDPTSMTLAALPGELATWSWPGEAL